MTIDQNGSSGGAHEKGPAGGLDVVPKTGTIRAVEALTRRHRGTLEAIFARPVRAGIRWSDIEALFVALGAVLDERRGSRIAVILFDQVQVFHRPHPSPDTDRGAVTSVRKWLESNGVMP